MIETDTIKLLRECDAGVKMGIQSISEVLDRVQNYTFRELLYTCKKEHEKLERELQKLLHKYEDEGKGPNFIAETMAKLKTEMKLQLNETDQTIAGLMTDGCNMGVKSLNRYLNQYTAADEASKNITKRLIHLEEQLAIDIRNFL